MHVYFYSGPDDIVFVNFADHGAYQILGFPGGSEPLHANELATALNSMTNENRFSKVGITYKIFSTSIFLH